MTLIIYAHPNKEGNCGKILNFTEKTLKEKNIGYELIDLYENKYNPCLLDKEHYTSGKFEISEQNKAFQKQIQENKNIIFIYPIWWGSMPAILKGFFDRVFTSRFAFKYKKKFGMNGTPSTSKI